MNKIWHKFPEDQPKTKGPFVVCNCYEFGAPWLATLEYSPKHRKFNVCDHYDDSEAADVAIEPTYWAELSSIIPNNENTVQFTDNIE